jgi:hypothetical protein
MARQVQDDGVLSKSTVVLLHIRKKIVGIPAVDFQGFA